MAATASYMASISLSMLGWRTSNSHLSNRSIFFSIIPTSRSRTSQRSPNTTRRRNHEAKTRRLGQWLSSTTRHVSIYAAYIDPETCEFDQTQMDKLTLLLDPTDEFVWTDESCNNVYSYFQELVDHYEGARLTEYTLRLIGSDIEHYTRKMLYQGETQYNMDAKVLNFSMGKPRVGFSYNGQLPEM